MTAASYTYLNGRVEVVEYIAPYSNQLLGQINKWCDDSRRANYKANYIEGPGDKSSLQYLIRTGQIPRFYVCYVDQEFAFFSGVRDVDNYLMVGVRTLSNRQRKDALPYHTAYVIPLQVEYARKMGYQYCFSSYNVGARTGFYRKVLRLRDRATPTDPVTTLAKETLQQFLDVGEYTINYVKQHVLLVPLLKGSRLNGIPTDRCFRWEEAERRLSLG